MSRTLIRKILEKFGYEARTAGKSRTAGVRNGSDPVPLSLVGRRVFFVEWSLTFVLPSVRAHQVTAMEDGEQCVQAFCAEPFALIVTDINMCADRPPRSCCTSCRCFLTSVLP